MIRKRPNLCEVKKFIQNSIWKIFFPAISPERDVDEKIEKTSRLRVFVAQIAQKNLCVFALKKTNITQKNFPTYRLRGPK